MQRVHPETQHVTGLEICGEPPIAVLFLGRNGVGVEPLSDRLGIADMFVHAQRQRLETLKQQERIEW